MEVPDPGELGTSGARRLTLGEIRNGAFSAYAYRARCLPDPWAGLRCPIPPQPWSRAFRLGSAATIVAVRLVSKIFMGLATRSKVYEAQHLDLLRHREGKPLITIANHASCIDDPFLWGLQSWAECFQPRLCRWTLGADNVCFTTKATTTFFSLGRTFPVTRGAGIYQNSMNRILELLNAGEWIHLYPEAKVNFTERTLLPLKWGVGRLICEAKEPPIVLPMWHEGMADVLPEHKVFPRPGKKVTLLVGEPVDMGALLEPHRREATEDDVVRKEVTDHLAKVLWGLSVEARDLHQRRL